MEMGAGETEQVAGLDHDSKLEDMSTGPVGSGTISSSSSRSPARRRERISSRSQSALVLERSRPVAGRKAMVRSAASG